MRKQWRASKPWDLASIEHGWEQCLAATFRIASQGTVCLVLRQHPFASIESLKSLDKDVTVQKPVYFYTVKYLDKIKASWHSEQKIEFMSLRKW